MLPSGEMLLHNVTNEMLHYTVMFLTVEVHAGIGRYLA